MLFPKLKVPKTHENSVNVFGGINRTPGCPENCFFDTQNLTSDHFPLLSVRSPRVRLTELSSSPSLLYASEKGLVYTIGTRLYLNGILQTSALSDTPKKQIVPFGRRLFIFPDGYYFNPNSLSSNGISYDQGRMSSHFTPSCEFVNLVPCTSDNYFPYIRRDVPPHPVDNDLWLDISSENTPLYIYSSQYDEWTPIAPTQLRIDCEEIDTFFSEGDTVEISGLGHGLDGPHKIESLDVDCMIIQAQVDSYARIDAEELPDFSVQRKIPVMDFVCEHQNRMFGCRYGLNSDGKFVNEIYASKLGDPFNWNTFEGISTDSYAASCGSEGEWTGISSLMGNVLFFKENRIHRLFGSKPSNYTVYEDRYPGVRKNSESSLCEFNGTLYYHSADGIYAYSGSAPVSVSRDLGNDVFSHAAAAMCRKCYCVSMTGKDGERSLYSYDTEKNIWHRMGLSDYVFLSSTANNAVGVRQTGNVFAVEFLLPGDIPEVISGSFEGQTSTEQSIEWFAETGLLGLSFDERKYLNKLNLRFDADNGTLLKISILTDGNADWEECGSFSGQKTGSYSLEFLPPRCDRFKLKISGTGQCRIYSLTKTIECGGDAQDDI